MFSSLLSLTIDLFIISVPNLSLSPLRAQSLDIIIEFSIVMYRYI